VSFSTIIAQKRIFSRARVFNAFASTFSLTPPVPTPAPLALLGLGVGALLLRTQRARR
jgi:hypothetical protein